jgi:acetylornithine deacetylase/succinyl-diaminopimelate desuccinylase-like protein
MLAETARLDLESMLANLKIADPYFAYEFVHPVERSFNTWILDHPPMDMPVGGEIVQAIARAYRRVTGAEPRGIGLPASPLGARYGAAAAHLWRAGIPAPIYGPSGGSNGDDYSLIDEMVLCSQVLALTAVEICG